MSLIAAQPQITLGPIGGDDGFGPFSIISSDPVKVIKDLATGISNLVGFLTILAGLWFGFQFIMAGFSWITSGGDKTNLEAARNKMSHAFIGLLIVVAAWAIIAVLGKFFGLDILLTNPAGICRSISPNPDICP